MGLAGNGINFHGLTGVTPAPESGNTIAVCHPQDEHATEGLHYYRLSMCNKSLITLQ